MMLNDNVTRVAGQETVSDCVLVQRGRAGDSAAFSTLVSRYQDRVYNACYRMCNHEADALDLTQTTFLRAFQAIGRFEAKSSFYTWIFRIAVNLSLSHRRQGRRRPSVSLDQLNCDGLQQRRAVQQESCDVGSAVERHELCERLQDALARLDEDFRAAVVLKDIEDMDYATIAEIVGVPVGTVKSRVHRGRLMLRKLLNQEAD